MSQRAQQLIAAIAAWDKGNPDESNRILRSAGLMEEFKHAAEFRTFGACAGPRDILAGLLQKEHGSSSAGSEQTSKGCFIATACYGAYDHPSVQEFRWFRDARLNQYEWGRIFIGAYYRFSPPVAAFLKKTPATAAIVRRCVLGPILMVVRLVHGRNRT